MGAVQISRGLIPDGTCRELFQWGAIVDDWLGETIRLTCESDKKILEPYGRRAPCQTHVTVLSSGRASTRKNSGNSLSPGQ